VNTLYGATPDSSIHENLEHVVHNYACSAKYTLKIVDEKKGDSAIAIQDLRYSYTTGTRFYREYL
jgi:hypothetical protein